MGGAVSVESMVLQSMHHEGEFAVVSLDHRFDPFTGSTVCSSPAIEYHRGSDL